MTEDRFRQIEEVFNQVADAPEPDRPALLEELCGDDKALRAEAETLVASLGQASTQIQAAIGKEAAAIGRGAVRPAPRRLGPYRLVRELGHGGMGAVYLANRDDAEYRNQVAIKLLHRGLETSEAVARFRDERQILASLEHPGIVRLLDGGRTEEGLPYLVMEHVEGVPITDWADKHDPDIRGRVELFRKVCAAVTYAHQKLVVHRDLKPGNILVTPDGTPKLLDFGIAKLMDPGAGREAHTGTGMRLLTPDYASPEQIRGEPVTTATDVYALGAILYELLTGVPAQRFDQIGLKALKSVLEKDPPLPSLVSPASRKRAIAGDLDNIVMKALQKDTARRYASVEQLADDLGRHLEGLPVQARAGTWTYRAGKLLVRSRRIVAAITVILMSMTAATVISVRQAKRADEQARRADEQAKRAQKRFDEVRSLANSLLFEIDEKIQNLEGATEAREVIVRRALTYLDGLAAESGDDPALSRELAAAYVRIGEIQGNPLVPNLGRPQDGLESCTKARKILDALLASGSGDVATRWALVRVLFGIAGLEWAMNGRDLARKHGLEALEIAASLPDDATYEHKVVARGYVLLYELALEDGDIPLATRQAESCLDVSSRWAKRDPSREARYWIGAAHEARGGALLSGGDPDGAVRELRESASIFGELTAAESENAPYRRELWLSRSFLAMCLSGVGDSKIWLPHVVDIRAAEEETRVALSLAEANVQRDPHDARAVAQLAYTLDQLGAIVVEKDAEAALSLFQRARAAIAGLPAPFRESEYARQFEWLGQCSMAVPLGKLGRKDEAIAATNAGLAIADKDAAAKGASLDLRMRPLMCRFLSAQAHRAVGDQAKAAALLQQVREGLRPMVADRPSILVPYIGLVDTLVLEGELSPGERCHRIEEARAAWRSWPGTPTPFTRRKEGEVDAILGFCR